jgi:protein-S-isoprenylcysteine O-methyltransferase Ste14
MAKKPKRFVIAALSALVGAIVGALSVRRPFFEYHEFGRVLPSIILWALFFGYWGIASRGAAPTETSESNASTLLHQFVLAGALLLLLLPVPGLTARWLPGTPLVEALGLAIQSGFLLLAVWARRHLGRNWSAEVRIAVDHELVRTGPYRLLRHPIYTAMLGMFLGSAVVYSELHSLLALIILSVAYWRKTRLEEEILLKTFGADYDGYRRTTWSLVPWLY